MQKINPINVNSTQQQFAMPFRASMIRPKLNNLRGLKIDTFELNNVTPKEFNPAEGLEVLNKIGIRNLRLCGSKSISGETLEARPDALEELKKLGINTIIDLRADDKYKYKSLCESKGLKYFSFPLHNSYAQKNQAENPEMFGEKMKQFFDIFNKESIYIACNYGIDRTNIALSLNYLLNPESHRVPSILTWDGNDIKGIVNSIHKQVKKILKSLSIEQKQEIGITKYDEEHLHSKIKNIQNKNAR